MGICDSIKQKYEQYKENARIEEENQRRWNNPNFSVYGEAFGLSYLSIFNQIPDSYKNLHYNWQNNKELLDKIDEENKTMAPKMAQKIKELIGRGANSGNPKMIGTGNSCNNDCYMYNIPIMSKCPKCGGRSEEKDENGFTTEERYDETLGGYKTAKILNESNICTGYRWNNNVNLKDVDLDELFKFYDKEDHANKVHWAITVIDKNTKEKSIKEEDVPRHYAIIDGERFDFPYGINMRVFFFFNEELFFPKAKLADINNGNALSYSNEICFWYERQGSKRELGQSIGHYGYAWIHKVRIYVCNSCGYKYHIIKTSPFAWENR